MSISPHFINRLNQEVRIELQKVGACSSVKLEAWQLIDNIESFMVNVDERSAIIQSLVQALKRSAKDQKFALDSAVITLERNVQKGCEQLLVTVDALEPQDRDEVTRSVKGIDDQTWNRLKSFAAIEGISVGAAITRLVLTAEPQE